MAHAPRHHRAGVVATASLPRVGRDSQSCTANKNRRALSVRRCAAGVAARARHGQTSLAAKPHAGHPTLSHSTTLGQSRRHQAVELGVSGPGRVDGPLSSFGLPTLHPYTRTHGCLAALPHQQQVPRRSHMVLALARRLCCLCRQLVGGHDGVAARVQAGQLLLHADAHL